jgi:hypothetical protein
MNRSLVGSTVRRVVIPVVRIQLIKNEIKEDFPDLCKIVDQCEKHFPVVYFLSN